jgi:ribosome recycling factor
VKRFTESAHVAIRNIRRDQMEKIKAAEKEKQVSADEAKRAGERLQKVADRYIAKVDEVGARKEAEIMEV